MSCENDMVASAIGKSASAVSERGVKINAPIIAAGAAAVAASVAAAPGVAGWLGAGLALLMLAIAAVDARRFIIPAPLNAAGLALGLLHAAAPGEGDMAGPA